MLIAMCSFNGCNRHSNQLTIPVDEIKIESDKASMSDQKSSAVRQQINTAHGQKYSLAIFPCKIIDSRSASTTMTYKHSISTIYPKIREYDEFNVKYSFDQTEAGGHFSS